MQTNEVIHEYKLVDEDKQEYLLQFVLPGSDSASLWKLNEHGFSEKNLIEVTSIEVK